MITELPKAWRWESLAELGVGGLFVDGAWVESKDQDPSGTVRLTQLADVGAAHFRDRSNRWLLEDQAERLSCTRLQPMDILIARMPDPIARACLVPNDIGAAVTVVDVAILRVKRPDIDARYVMWAINSPEFHQRVVAKESGTTRKRISRRNLSHLLIPLPPLEEQRRIVDLLDDHLSRLSAANALLELATRRTVSLERAALDSFTAQAETLVPLGDLVQRVEAGKSYGSASRPAADDEWAIIKVSAMTWGRFKPDENKVVNDVARVDPRYEIRPGDLLVSRANTSAYVGAAVLVETTRSRLLLSDKSLRLVPHRDVLPAYLHAALRAPRTRRQLSELATGTKDSMRNISQGALLKVLVPAANAEQQSRVVDQVRAFSASSIRLRAELVRARDRGGALRRSVLAAAFTGTLTADLPQVHRLTDV